MVLDTTIAKPSLFGPKLDGNLGPALDGGDSGDQDNEMMNFDAKQKNLSGVGRGEERASTRMKKASRIQDQT
jgi:hypothetical protein